MAVAEQLPSPEVTTSSGGHQHPSQFHPNPSLSQNPPTELRGVANPSSEESCTSLHSNSQDSQIRAWVLGTEGSEENGPQSPPIEPYPDPYASSCGEDPESIASTAARSDFYTSTVFPVLLEQHGIYMDDSASGLDKEELEFCQKLLSTSAPHPPHSMLDEDVFLSISDLTRNKSQQWLVKNMHPHLFPAPELLALRGHDEFKGLGLIEGCDDVWLRAIFPSYGEASYGECPQPDSTIAFKWENFSREEVLKLGITMGLPSMYMARDDMFFPVITRESGCDAQPLEFADRQNVYSMSVALEGVIDLFRRVDRLEELNGKALGLSMSCDNDRVMMYAHHVVTDAQEPSGQSRQQLPEPRTMKYRTMLDQVFLSNDGGKDRWKPYDFLYNACLKFSRRHLTRIKEAIALLPDLAESSLQSVPCVDEVGQDLQDGDGMFKKPRNGGVNGELRKQLAGLERQLARLERQLEASDRRESALQDQLAKLRDDSESRESALQDQLAKLRDDSKSRESALQAQLDRLLQLLETRSK